MRGRLYMRAWLYMRGAVVNNAGGVCICGESGCVCGGRLKIKGGVVAHAEGVSICGRLYILEAVVNAGRGCICTGVDV